MSLVSRGKDAAGNLRLAFDPAAFNALDSTVGRHEIRVAISETESLALKMERFEVIAPGARFLINDGKTSRRTSAPQVIALRGEIENEPGSHAFLALTGRGGGSGSIVRANGRQFQIAGEYQGDRPSGLILHEGPGDAPDFPDFCKVLVPPEPAHVGFGGAGMPQNAARGPRLLIVAVDSDQAYANLFADPADAQAYMVQVMAAVSDIYMRDLQFRVMIGFSRVWPDGGEPISASDLSGFRNYWLNNEDMSGINLVHMFSGRRNLAYGGIAFLIQACDSYDFGITGFMLGGFPSPVLGPNLGNWDVIVPAHEMGHNLGTVHTHEYVPPIDQCTSGTFERSDIMSYCHTRPGGLLNIDMRFHSRVQDVIANTNAFVVCLPYDCNGNGVDDAQDISVGISMDANADGIPDECEDCNGDGILNDAEIAAGAADINRNGIPDSCEPDCNSNGLPDAWEVAQGMADDFNGNRIPDSCEPDCNGNGVADFLDIKFGSSIDLDRNSVPDECQDCNGNGLPDWIDVDRQHNIFIAQTGNSIREYHAASGVFIRDVGRGLVDQPYDITFGVDRQLYVASFGDSRIVRIDVDTGAASDFVAEVSGGLENPAGLTFGPNGNLFVSSQGNSCVLQYDGQTGELIGTFVSPGDGLLVAPWQLAFGPNGNLFVVSGDNRVLEFDGRTGAFVRDFVDALKGNLNGPRGLLFLSNGDLLVTNRAGNKVTHYDSAGNYAGLFAEGYPVQLPWGITCGPNGNVYIARTNPDLRVIEYDRIHGWYIRSFVRGDSQLTAPTAFAFRPASPHDTNGNDIPDACERQPCPADVDPPGGNGYVNVDDLLAVINSWGQCPVPPRTERCPADIDPIPNGDGYVNVDDLLTVINNWGMCP